MRFGTRLTKILDVKVLFGRQVRSEDRSAKTRSARRAHSMQRMPGNAMNLAKTFMVAAVFAGFFRPAFAIAEERMRSELDQNAILEPLL
jgi:hypothetical protein